MKTLREIYNELFKEWLKLTGIKLGDTVRIVREFKFSDEHSISFPADMGCYIGETATVDGIFHNAVRLKHSDGKRWTWDFRSLEVEHRKEDEDETFSSGTKVEVCNTVYTLITFEFNDKWYFILVTDDGSRWDDPQLTSKSYRVTYSDIKRMATEEDGTCEFEILRNE